MQVNQEMALRVELKGRVAQGQSLVETLNTQLDAQKEMTAQWRELYQSMAVTVPIRPIHSDAGLSLLGFLSIGTVPFPLGTLCRHPLSGCPGRLFMIQGVHQPSPCTWGCVCQCIHRSLHELRRVCSRFNVCARVSI